MNCYQLARAWQDEARMFHRREAQQDEYDAPAECPTCGGEQFEDDGTCVKCGWWLGEPSTGWMYGA